MWEGTQKTQLRSEARKLSSHCLIQRLGRLLHLLHTSPVPHVLQEVKKEVVEEDLLHIDALGVMTVGEGTYLYMFTGECMC